MKNVMILNTRGAGPLVSMALLLFGTLPAQADIHRVILPAGTVIPVKLDQELSSKTAHEGDKVTVTVREGDDDGGFPEGTRIDGVIREVHRASKDHPGVLDIDFRHMSTLGGQSREMSGSIISLDDKYIEHSESGLLTAKPDKSKERLKFIGIGAGAGLLIGSLTGKNELTTTVLGAAAGYLYNEFGKKPKPTDVTLKAGSEFGIKVDREFAFQTKRADKARTTAQNRDTHFQGVRSRTSPPAYRRA